MVEKIIVIIGAGIIGASSAIALQQDGHKVLLIDRQAPCAGASSGNAGAIVNGASLPTAMPGIIFDVMKMITRSNTPFSIRPAYLPQILPWLLRFLWQSRPSAAHRNAKHLFALSQHAVSSWHRLTDNTVLSGLLLETGWLKVYESEKTFVDTRQSRKLMDQVGTKYELLSADQIRDLEPNLAAIYQHGFFQKDCLNIINPKRFVLGLVDLFVSRGGSYRQFGVDQANNENNKISLSGPNGVLVTDKVIIAAGAWSRSLARQLGDDVPLDAERGYHLMLPESTRNLLNRPVVNAESSFVLSPMEMGLRMTCQVELAGLNASPDYGRARSLLPLAKRMLPSIDTHEESVWMGFRPSIPDSLPVLGFSSKSENVLYAFGHHHLGITLGAISALVIADLVAGREPAMDASAYRPDRF